jgi:hydroxymethylglutaryl-CoA reductase
MTTSRIPGFYQSTLQDKLSKLAEASGLTPDDLAALQTAGLTPEQAESMVENAIGTFGLPLGIGLNFVVNGREVLVPMAIEEPSVIAGASFMAKLARGGGGFTVTTTEPLMIGQMQVLDLTDLQAARQAILENKLQLLEQADAIDPVLKKLGGGARDLEVRLIETSPIGPFLVVHLIYDVRDAMGANAVNTACEKLAPQLEQLTGGRVHLRILSKTADWRAQNAPSHWLTWLSPPRVTNRALLPASRSGMVSLPPGHLLLSIPTVLPPTTRVL